MRLTTFSDYAIRLLMFAAANRDRLITIEEASEAYGVSRGHLMKVTNLLTRVGFLKAVRGRAGGLTLGMEPKNIRLGDVVRAAEPDFALVECFDERNGCIVTRRCTVPNVLNEALSAFFATLDRYTLEDVALKSRAFVPPSGPLGVRGPRIEPGIKR